MNTKTEGTLAIVAALIVLTSALLSPPIAAAISIITLVAFGVYKLVQKKD